MKHRCINAFWYAGKVYPGGVEVDANDPILTTHASHFTPTETAEAKPSPRIEQATATPGELRQVAPAKRRGRPPKNQPPVVVPEPEPKPEQPVSEPETEENE